MVYKSRRGVGVERLPITFKKKKIEHVLLYNFCLNYSNLDYMLSLLRVKLRFFFKQTAYYTQWQLVQFYKFSFRLGHTIFNGL